MAVKIITGASFVLGLLALETGVDVVVRVAWLYIVTGARG
jgi:hypothetical protein